VKTAILAACLWVCSAYAQGLWVGPGVRPATQQDWQEYDAAVRERRTALKMRLMQSERIRAAQWVKDKPARDAAAAIAAKETAARVVVWQQERAAAGSAQAQSDLAARYLAGDGVERDLALARRWAQAAAEQEFAGARELLAKVKAAESEPALAAAAPLTEPDVPPPAATNAVPAPATMLVVTWDDYESMVTSLYSAGFCSARGVDLPAQLNAVELIALRDDLDDLGRGFEKARKDMARHSGVKVFRVPAASEMVSPGAGEAGVERALAIRRRILGPGR
jgi:hypothetical protein